MAVLFFEVVLVIVFLSNNFKDNIVLRQVVTLRLSLYIIGSNAVPPPLLDLVAYSSYKFVILVVDLLIWIISAHNSTIYWITSILTGCSMAVFMVGITDFICI